MPQTVSKNSPSTNALPSTSSPASHRGTTSGVERPDLEIDGVSTYVSVGFPRPLPAMIRNWIRTYQQEDLQASLTALQNALASRRQRRLMEYQ
jgi:hypothetical protein